MKRVDRSIYAILAVLVAVLMLRSGILTQTKPADLKPTVILISLDGFRWDYLDKYRPPTLVSLAKSGVRAKWMIPSFPTKTFPNHYSIVTGLFPQNHGIVENNVYDFGEVFTMSKPTRCKIHAGGAVNRSGLRPRSRASGRRATFGSVPKPRSAEFRPRNGELTTATCRIRCGSTRCSAISTCRPTNVRR